MGKLTKPLKEIECRLSTISNYDGISKSPYWAEWVNTVFSLGMVGLDNIDVYNLVKERECELIKIEAKSLEKLKGHIRATVDPSCHGIVAGVVLPEDRLDLANEVLEMLILQVNKECEVLMQALCNSLTYVVLLLVVH